jgi:hypothetical protein
MICSIPDCDYMAWRMIEGYCLCEDHYKEALDNRVTTQLGPTFPQWFWKIWKDQSSRNRDAIQEREAEEKGDTLHPGSTG